MNAIVACLLLLAAGCLAAPVDPEQSEPVVKEQNEPIAKEQRLPLSQRKLEQLDDAVKMFVGSEYSLDDFSKPAQLFIWKVWKMAEIQDEAEWIQRKIGSLKEDLVQELDQHALLAFMRLSRETQIELEAAMPALKGLQDSEEVQKIMGDICSAKTDNDAELGFDEGSEEPSSPEEQ